MTDCKRCAELEAVLDVLERERDEALAWNDKIMGRVAVAEKERDALAEKLAEAENHLNGDPDGKATPEDVQHWRRSAINYADKVEKKLAEFKKRECWICTGALDKEDGNPVCADCFIGSEKRCSEREAALAEMREGLNEYLTCGAYPKIRTRCSCRNKAKRAADLKPCPEVLARRDARMRAEGLKEAARIECRHCRDGKLPVLQVVDMFSGEVYTHNDQQTSICVSTRLWERAQALESQSNKAADSGKTKEKQ